MRLSCAWRGVGFHDIASVHGLETPYTERRCKFLPYTIGRQEFGVGDL